MSLTGCEKSSIIETSLIESSSAPTSDCEINIPSVNVLQGIARDKRKDELIAQMTSSSKKVNKPFFFFHTGDGDYISLGWGSGGSGLEGLDLEADCISKAMKRAFDLPHTDNDQVSTCPNSKRKTFYPDLHCAGDPMTAYAVGPWWFCNDIYGPGVERDYSARQKKVGGDKFTFVDIFYLLGLDVDGGTDVKIFSETNLKTRPLVWITSSFLHKKISCKHFPGTVGFIQSMSPDASNVCDQAAVATLQASVKKWSEQYPNQSVVFLLAGGQFNTAVLYEFWRKNLYEKDIIISIGSVIDTFGGHADRDYNMDWEVDCEKSKCLLPPEIRSQYCTSSTFKCPAARFDDDCRAGYEEGNTPSTNEMVEVL